MGAKPIRCFPPAGGRHYCAPLPHLGGEGSRRAMYADLAAIIAPVLVCSAIGYGWARLGRPWDAQFATALVTNVGAPCLVGSTLTRLPLDPGSLAEIGLASLAAFASFALIGIVVLKAARLSLRS